MARFIRVLEEEGGWSDWQSPYMNRRYKLACCDCSLVHDLIFRVVRVTKRMRKGRFELKVVKGFKVQFKARRNTRSTAVMRAHAKRKKGA